jgi:hypothetical protein
MELYNLRSLEQRYCFFFTITLRHYFAQGMFPDSTMVDETNMKRIRFDHLSNTDV